MDREPARSIEILLVEDNEADVRLTVEAMKVVQVHNEVHVARNGEDAMDYLRREGGFKDAPRPDLVLLDLNLPRRDGREVLADIKTDPQLRRIPVVVLTTSQEQEDILKAYDLGANCYITKPVDLDQFVKVIKSIEEFWLTIVKLP